MGNADGKIIIATEIDTKSFEKEIEATKNKLDRLEKSYTKALNPPKGFVKNEEALKNLQLQIEKTRNHLIDLENKQKEIGDNTKTMTLNISKGFNKGTSSMKRFALSLFSAGSIFAVVSKASSAYLSQNEELANKLQNVWIGLGSFLEPAINVISDAMLKGLGYLNEFIKALTGVDYIAKTNAKALEKQANAQNKLNKSTQQYDFDVIRRQQTTSNGTGISSDTTTSGLIQIPKLDQNVIDKLKDLAEWLQKNWGWLKKVGEAFILVFGAVEVAKTLKGMKQIIGGLKSLIGSSSAGTGLAGVGAGLLAIADIILVSMAVDKVKEIKQGVDELNASLDTLNNNARGNIARQEKLSETFWETYKSSGVTTEQINAYVQSLNNAIGSEYEQYKELEKQKTILGEVTGKNQKLTEQQLLLYEKLSNTTTEYGKLYDAGLLSKEQASDYIIKLGDQIKIMEELGIKSDVLKDKYKNLAQKYNIQIDAKYNVDMVIKPSIQAVTGTGILGNLINMGLIKGGKGKAFARGGLVTQPTKALIGEAGYNEYVIPEQEDYLSRLAGLIAEYGSSNNTPVNIYLDGRLIQRQVSNKQSKVNFATNR